MDYQLYKWKRQDWRKNTCHYSCEVRQNPFGQWVVLRRGGRVSAMQGQCIKEVCDSLSERQSQRYEQGLKTFEAVEKKQVKQGYRAW